MKQFTTADSTGRWILVATILASSMAFIESSALNVALDSLQRDLQASGTQLLWIVNIYMLFLAALILLGGSLGDHFGRNRIFGAGIIIFSASSIACGLAPDAGFLVFARAVQGVGSALMVPGSLAIISALFADSDRGKAIGIWSAASTITTMGGPVLGGFLADQFSWRYVFFIIVPLAIIALFALSRVPENKDENASPRMDYLGAFLITLGLAGITYGLITLGDTSNPDNANRTLAIVAFIVGVVGLISFVIVERRIKDPMVDLRLFQSRTFTGANLMTAFLYAGLSGALLFFPLNLTQIQGYTALVAGWAFLPFGILVSVLSPFAGNMVDRYGPKIPLTLGPIIVGIGFLLLAMPGVTAGPDAYWTTYFPGILALGIGMGITIAPLTATVMNTISQDNAGIASGINNAVTRSAQVLATAILGAVALVAFNSFLMTSTNDLGLTNATRITLEQSASDLGNTQSPDGLDTATTAAVEAAISQSFVDMFRILNFIAAALAFISAIMSAFVLEPQHKEKPKRSGEWYESTECFNRSLATTTQEVPAVEEGTAAD